METRLRESEDAAEAERETASQHAEILAKVFAAGILVDYCKFRKSTTSPLRLREWLATGSRLCMYKDGHCVHFLLWTVGLRLGSQYVALARRAMPRCRVARIDSISIFVAGRDVGRRDGAMRHIVNVALVSSHVLPCKCYHYCHIVLIVLFCVYKCLLDITISFSLLSFPSPSLLPLSPSPPLPFSPSPPLPFSPPPLSFPSPCCTGTKPESANGQ